MKPRDKIELVKRLLQNGMDAYEAGELAHGRIPTLSGFLAHVRAVAAKENVRRHLERIYDAQHLVR